MSRPTINLVLHPGEPGCLLTVTTATDQIQQQFGAPQEALDAALFAGAALALVCEEHEAALKQARVAEVAEVSDEDEHHRTKPVPGSFLDEAGPLAGAAPTLFTGEIINDPHGETDTGRRASQSAVPQDQPGFCAPPADAATAGPPLTADQQLRQRIEYYFAAARETAAAALRTAKQPGADLVAVARLLEGAADNYDAAVAHDILQTDGAHQAQAGQVLKTVVDELQALMPDTLKHNESLCASIDHIRSLIG